MSPDDLCCSITLKIPPDEARRELDQIASKRNTHDKFRKSLRNNHWDPVRKLKRSICWLFCWAHSGARNSETKYDARRAFDRIFSRLNFPLRSYRI